MTTTIDKQINEALRDALVAYYLDEVVPHSPKFKELGISQALKNADDLYQFLLLDVQVSQEVQTSRVASAIASMQQYVNSILLGLEPGYEIKPMEPHLVEQWRDQQAQYPLWAANQQLAWYPEVYIDPSLRLKKSDYFRQLENDINQNKIEVHTVQEAVKSYLTNFERVANLSIINGYVTTDDFANGTYYFIGKSRGETAYYWRSVDMSQRSYKQGATGPKFDNPQPGAWSDWKEASLPVSETALEHTVRPVYFNNRLFVSWVEYIAADEAGLEAGPGDAPEVVTKSHVRLVTVYKKHDDSWSTPQIHLTIYTNEKPETFDSIAVQDSATTLFIALYAGHVRGSELDGSKDKYACLKTARIDRNFNVTPLFPSAGKVPNNGINNLKQAHVLKVSRLFALTNKDRLQFRMPALTIALKSVSTWSEFKGSAGWDIQGRQTAIANASTADVTYDQAAATLEFRSKLGALFAHEKEPITLEHVGHYAQEMSFKFIIDPTFSHATHVRLAQGSTITPKTTWMDSAGNRYTLSIGETAENGEAKHSPDCLTDSLVVSHFTVPALAAGTAHSLQGKYLTKAAIAILTPSLETVIGSVIFKTDSAGKLSLSSGLFGHSYKDVTTSFQHYISRPNKILDGGVKWHQNYASNYTSLVYTTYNDKRSPPDTLVLKVGINEETLRPDWGDVFPPTNSIDPYIPLVHGVAVRENNQIIGYANKAVLVVLELRAQTNKGLKAPMLNTSYNETLGTAEYIDFTGSDIAHSDGSTQNRAPLRMNTLFARELTEKVDVALEYLLSWETQGLPEPPLPGGSGNNVMDFHGANGLYFWELFLHLPFLISHRLNLEHDFHQSERWLGFIFDPSRKADSKSGRPAFWNVRPLIEEKTAPDYATRAAVDPDGIAASHPIRYRKALFTHYLKNLIDQGDAAYRQLSPDSLGEAKLWYMRVLELLGNRPDVRLVDNWTPIPLKALSSDTNANLRAFELQLAEQDQLRMQSAEDNGGKSAYTFQQAPLRLRTFSPDTSLPELENPHLRVPLNFKLVALWDTLESRLKNLRSNRTLDGKPLSLPTFASPLDPRDVLAAFGQNSAAGSGSRVLTLDTPHYRFNVMHARANAAVETLMQFGNTLLSLIERKEQAEFLELQHQHAWDFAQFAIDLQQQSLKVDRESLEALIASRQVAQGRLDFYSERSNENVSRGEMAAGAAHLAGRNAETVAAIANIVGSGLKAVPNHYGVIAGLAAGVATGGWRLEGIAEMASHAASGVAAQLHGVGESLDRVEQYRRRHQEWMHARDQAQLEIAQIDAQLDVLTEQQRITELQLAQAQTALAQARVTYAFLGKRFTRSQLYQWLNGQLASFYYQVYDTTLSLCLAAEASWQYEIGDFSTRFVQTSAWNDGYRGLMAGESLKLNLLKMETAYLTRNERPLEITKTISLRRLGEKDPASYVNGDWDAVVARLLQQGSVDFELTQALFDHDYPGHYCRRIKRVSVSLPITLGPYEDIRATLTQTYNRVELSDNSINSVRENLRASQQIALSSGVDDDGMFVLNFDDERYLPFEGTGAVSRWSLQFPNHQDQLAALESLTDIIVHVQYTAKASTGA